jgi:hypothetical protein
MGIRAGLQALAIGAALVCVAVRGEAATVFETRSTFLSQLGSYVTDTYSDPAYLSGDVLNGTDVDRFTNEAMSNVLGEVKYESLTHENANYISYNLFGNSFSNYYCAGCNGAFLLTFDDTSVSTRGGIFGLGFDFQPNFSATVAYTNGKTEDFSYIGPNVHNVQQPAEFFGITSNVPIQSILFKYVYDDENTIQTNIDNLTIGNRAVGAPGPIAGAGLPTLMALGGFVWTRRRKNAGPAVGA